MDKISEERIEKFRAFLSKPNVPYKSIKITDCPPLIDGLYDMWEQALNKSNELWGGSSNIEI